MTDTYAAAGPLGDGAETSTFFVRECGSVTFDSQGRIVTICVGLDRPVLALLDPRHAGRARGACRCRRATSRAPPTRSPTSPAAATSTSTTATARSCPTNERHVVEVAIARPGAALHSRRATTTSAARSPPGDGIVSVLPDWSGRLWFVTRAGRSARSTAPAATVRTLKLRGEGISNSFAVDETGGVFIVSDKALYRFDAGPGGGPQVSWRQRYPNSGVHKPGQSDAGSGTTPTLMRRRAGSRSPTTPTR